MAYVKVFPSYVNEYRNEKTSLWLRKVAYERYLTSGIDLYGIP